MLSPGWPWLLLWLVRFRGERAPAREKSREMQKTTKECLCARHSFAASGALHTRLGEWLSPVPVLSVAQNLSTTNQPPGLWLRPLLYGCRSLLYGSLRPKLPVQTNPNKPGKWKWHRPSRQWNSSGFRFYKSCRIFRLQNCIQKAHLAPVSSRCCLIRQAYCEGHLPAGVQKCVMAERLRDGKIVVAVRCGSGPRS